MPMYDGDTSTATIKRLDVVIVHTEVSIKAERYIVIRQSWEAGLMRAAIRGLEKPCSMTQHAILGDDACPYTLHAVGVTLRPYPSPSRTVVRDRRHGTRNYPTPIRLRRVALPVRHVSQHHGVDDTGSAVPSPVY